MKIILKRDKKNFFDLTARYESLKSIFAKFTFSPAVVAEDFECIRHRLVLQDKTP